MKNWKIIILFTVVILFTFSSIVISGLWKDKSTIRNVEFTGNLTLSKEEIFEFAHLNDSLICNNEVSLENIETRIAKHPNIKKVVVLKDGVTVKIEISEKNPFAAVSNGNDLFLVDDQLTIYPVKKEHINIDLPVISGLSAELGAGTYGKNDMELLKISQYIISQSLKINKSLYNYISEINFSNSNIVLITSDDATPVYFIDFSAIDNKNLNVENSSDIKNHQLLNAIDKNLILLNGFLKQVRVYRPANSFKYIDLRYNDLIITKTNNQQAQQ
ncbi:MAG: FtsQ-type POTRA domain-containing protein [Ignavibacteria bacterium]|nr:FtsQ-type POTRA domain-containing protein [Ignavibacteria bacterium]